MKEEFLSKIKQIGNHYGMELVPEGEYDFDIDRKTGEYDRMSADLIDDNRKIRFYVNKWAAGKNRILISGIFPHNFKGASNYYIPYGEKANNVITVSLNKTAEQIIRDMDNRFMPEYLKKLDEIIEKNRQDLQTHIEREAVIKHIADALECKYNTNKEYHLYYPNDYIKEIEVHFDNTIDIKLDNLPLDITLEVVRLVKSKNKQ